MLIRQLGKFPCEKIIHEQNDKQEPAKWRAGSGGGKHRPDQEESKYNVTKSGVSLTIIIIFNKKIVGAADG